MHSVTILKLTERQDKQIANTAGDLKKKQLWIAGKGESSQQFGNDVMVT